MTSARRAVIDVGTNSVKLLVAEVEGSIVRPVWEESKQTRLGHGFYADHVLQPGPIQNTAEAVAAFSNKAGELGATEARVIATSAAREARNPEQLIQAIEKASGLTVRVITGLEEANYVFRGVTSDPQLSHKRLLLLDVGGGSTEFIVGQDQKNQFAQSFPLGTVRLLGELELRDPPGTAQLGECRQKLRLFFDTEIGPKVRPALERSKTSASAQDLEFVGTGGSATILAGMEGALPSFDRERIEETRLSRKRLHWHVEHLWNMPAAQRRQVVGLPANRADVILTGTAIYECVMTYFDFHELRVSTRGLRFAVVMESQ
jgi:exopolyphosphatase / guanosine-5'-triphosphate,3'-diphosphate pyrophosphatase